MTDSAPDAYALGRSDAETARLILQHQVYAHTTRALFTAAGITAGMRVLDLGSGAGDVALLVAELVGPQGAVVGVDANADILTVARTRAAVAGRTNLEFRAGDLDQVGLGNDFDAVVGRWILMYLPDPADLVRRAAGRLRPGGIVAFQESDLRNPLRPYPAGPLHDEVIRWMTPPPGAPGPDTAAGPKLYATFLRAGLPAPQLRLESPIGGGPTWPGYDYLTATLRSLLPFLEQIGTVTAGQVDLDTLADRLRAEMVDQDGIQVLPAVIGAWSHT